MKTVDEGAGQEAQAAFADDVGGVEARGSGEGICLRRSMHDQYARRAALDSSPDDEQHELFTCGRTLRQRSHPVGYLKIKLQQEVLEYSAGTRSRTGRAGPRGAGKQARAQRTHRALAHGLAARRRPSATSQVGVKTKGLGLQKGLTMKFLRTWYNLFVFSARCLLNESRLGLFSYSIFRQRL